MDRDCIVSFLIKTTFCFTFGGSFIWEIEMLPSGRIIFGFPIFMFAAFVLTDGRNERIKGGEVVTEKSKLTFPHHLQLVTYRNETIQVFCGGTLIGEKYVGLAKILER